jgi:hypothetical protein
MKALQTLLLFLLFKSVSVAIAVDVTVPEGGFTVSVPGDVQRQQRLDLEQQLEELAATRPQPIMSAAGGNISANLRYWCFPQFRFKGAHFSSFIARLSDGQGLEQYALGRLQRLQGHPDTHDYANQNVTQFTSAAGVAGFRYSLDRKSKISSCWERHCGVVFTNRRNQVICLNAAVPLKTYNATSDPADAVFDSLRLD